MHKPGVVRDAIVGYLDGVSSGARIEDIHKAVEEKLGQVARSSVRSYLNLNTPSVFERIGRGRYRLKTAKAKS